MMQEGRLDVWQQWRARTDMDGDPLGDDGRKCLLRRTDKGNMQLKSSLAPTWEQFLENVPTILYHAVCARRARVIY